ncbi:MAG: PAS domain-containing protein [Desulfomonilaceae bacterium]
MSSDRLQNIEQIILNSITEGVITIDCSGKIQSANPSAERILGMGSSLFVNHHYGTILDDLRNLGLKKIMDRLIQDGIQTSHSEIDYYRTDGQKINLAISTSALNIDVCFDGLETFVIVFRDITAFKALDKVRNKALNHISHEMATPISVIRASVNSLNLIDDLSERQQRYLERINRNLDRLLKIEAMVEQILYPIHFLPVQFNVNDVLKKILDKIKQESAHRKIEFRFPEADFLFDKSDPSTFETTLVTLMKNAVENTPDGGFVEIQVNGNRDFLAIAVLDRGVGITLENQNFIFDGFHHNQETEDYATKKPYDFNAGGKGLELLRLKVISETHGFDLSFESSRCAFIPLPTDQCPGNIEICPHIKTRDECFASGGSTFYVKFR